jgi:hypothetical protein
MRESLYSMAISVRLCVLPGDKASSYLNSADENSLCSPHIAPKVAVLCDVPSFGPKLFDAA